jgi:guanylate kinase
MIEPQRQRGIPFVISSPSGGGKTTIFRALQHYHPEMFYSISATTRPPRPGEVDGQDYYFYSPERFERARESDEFIETAEVHGFNYGTPRGPLLDALAGGRDIVLDIDVQGGDAIRGSFPDAVLLFIVPPDLETLRERLERRRSEKDEVIATRLDNAERELGRAAEYDYVVVNDDLERTIAEVRAIVLAERCRTTRRLQWLHNCFPQSLPTPANSEGGEV